jgi:hypothetical protein
MVDGCDIMVETEAIKCETLFCKYCQCEIYTCDCGNYFKLYQKILCTEEGHFHLGCEPK